MNSRNITLTGITTIIGAAASAFGQCGAKNQLGSAGSEASNSAAIIQVSMHESVDDIVATAQKAGSFGTLLAAANAAGLVETLQSDGPFTVFAPTDDAFAKLGHETISSLLKPENKDKLAAVLTYHVVPGRVTAEQVVALDSAETANGQRVPIRVEQDSVRIGSARLVRADIECSNGIIHVIDSVLLPGSDLLDTAGEAGSFATLLAAADAAGLIETLRGDGPFTIFAPTDEAFAKLGQDAIQQLLLPRNQERLAAILMYHVVAGRVSSRDAVSAGSATSVLGEAITARLQDGRLQINGANVVANDIEASNGVIHVIDAVLIPETLPELAPAGRLLIGINYDHPSSKTRARLGLGSGEGILITGVTRGRGAEAAGLKRGDVILSIDGGAATLDSLLAAKEEAGFGGTVDIVVARTVAVEVTADRH